jgi:hypothetical protein
MLLSWIRGGNETVLSGPTRREQTTERQIAFVFRLTMLNYGRTCAASS